MITTKILDVRINPLTYPKTIKIIKRWVDESSVKIVFVSAVHFLVECHRNNYLKDNLKIVSLIVSDGMPLVWIIKLRKILPAERIYGPDLMLKLCREAQYNDWKVYFLGGGLNQGKELKYNLLKKFPRLKIAGYTETPKRPLSKAQNNYIINDIKKKEPDLVFVGLGCPLQESWMIENKDKFSKGIFIGVGAAFDFISKRKKQAPSLIQGVGLEWLFRLIQEPRRLFYRYTFLNTLFICLLVKQELKRIIKIFK